jgi:hypothetical protein
MSIKFPQTLTIKQQKSFIHKKLFSKNLTVREVKRQLERQIVNSQLQKTTNVQI